MLIYSSKLRFFGHFCLAYPASQTFFHSLLAIKGAYLSGVRGDSICRAMSTQRPSADRSSLFSISAYRASTSLRASPTPTNDHSLKSCRSRSPLSHTAMAGLRPKRSCNPPIRWRFPLSELQPGSETVQVRMPICINTVTFVHVCLSATGNGESRRLDLGNVI